MKRNTKIFIGIAILAVCILTVCVVQTLKDAQDSLILKPNNNTPPPTINETVKTELTELVLKQDDLFEIEFDGFEGEANVFVKQKNIPELDERISIRVNELDTQINISDESEGNKLSEEQREIRKLNASYFCAYEGNKDLSNGDIISVKCDTEGLKKVNIIIENEYKVEVKGLTTKAVEKLEPEISNNQKEEVIEKESDKFYYHDNGEFVWIYPNDVNSLSTDEVKDTVETAVIHVENEEELEIIKKRIRNKEIYADQIQLGLNVYSIDDGFAKAEEWKGVAG